MLSLWPACKGLASWKMVPDLGGQCHANGIPFMAMVDLPEISEMNK